jgi:hypothetical protein
MVNDQLTTSCCPKKSVALHRRIDRHSLAVLVVRPMYQSRRSARPVKRRSKDAGHDRRAARARKKPQGRTSTGLRRSWVSCHEWFLSSEFQNTEAHQSPATQLVGRKRVLGFGRG